MYKRTQGILKLYDDRNARADEAIRTVECDRLQRLTNFVIVVVFTAAARTSSATISHSHNLTLQLGITIEAIRLIPRSFNPLDEWLHTVCIRMR
ncbi:MAG: hypothetical protein ABI988_18060, partial [Nitrospirota bacterium]